MSDLIAGAIGLGGDLLNYGAQQDALQWQKQAQQTTWNREDTAQQRAVADLRAAGLSPTLAAGSGSPTSAAPRIQAPELKLSNAIQASQAMMSLMKGKADITKTEEETKGQQIANSLATGTLDSNIERSKIAATRERETLQAAIDQVNNRTIPEKEINQAKALIAQSGVAEARYNALLKKIESTQAFDTQKAKTIALIAAYQLQQLQTEGSAHNIAIAKLTGSPVNSVPTGWVGQAAAAARQLTGTVTQNYASEIMRNLDRMFKEEQ